MSLIEVLQRERESRLLRHIETQERIIKDLITALRMIACCKESDLAKYCKVIDYIAWTTLAKHNIDINGDDDV